MKLFIECGNRRGNDVTRQNKHKVVHTEEYVTPRRTVPQSVAEPYTEQRYASRKQRTKVVAELLRAEDVRFFIGFDMVTG